ncbi:MAG: aspartyl protease family protein [Myxococcota bacterium]|nr:aspartyl protease family protein [Myxococcota bacterium]
MARAGSVEELDEREVNEPRPRPGCLAIVLGVTALPVALLAIGALTGIGLARNLASFQAVAAALALVVLPAVGIASLIRAGSRLGALGVASWLWALVVLLTVPFYFPGERARALTEGLELLATPSGDIGREWALAVGDTLVGLLGPEPEATPFAGALPTVAVEAARAAEGARRAREVREARGDVVVPYEGRGEHMQVAAFFDGPRYGEEFSMIFDTGATYTTLNRSALELLEIEVPRDAPIAILRTASGEIEAPLVMVDAIWLGDAVVEWVTVAVCEPCATDEVSGLLGLNVSGQFQVALDHDHHQVELSALDSAEDRKLDVSRWLTLGSRVLHWQDGRVEVEVTGENTAQVAIREFSVEIACPGGRFEVIVEGLGGGESVTRKMALPRGTDCSEYVSELREATWERSRF